MTAHAVGPLSAFKTSSKGAPQPASKDSMDAFGHQLHAARQQAGPAKQERTASHEVRPDREPAPGHSRHSDHSSREVSSRDAGHSSSRLHKGASQTSTKGDARENAGSAARPTARASAPAVAGETTPSVAEAAAGAASNDEAAAKNTTEGNEQGAAALVGAMLALIDPAAVKMLTPGVAGVAGATAAAVAAGGTEMPGAAPFAMALVLQAGDAAAAAVTATPAQLFAAGGLPLDQKRERDALQVDGMPTLGLAAPAATASGAPISVPIAAPAGSHAFAQELGQQVAWFVGQDVKQARIRLHPEELGSLDLKISVNHGRVDVVFHAQHPGAVTAVQQSLPQLEQMLAQHGLSLGNTEVGQHDRGGQSQSGGQGDSVSETEQIHGPSLVTPLGQLGLLDAFA